MLGDPSLGPALQLGQTNGQPIGLGKLMDEMPEAARDLRAGFVFRRFVLRKILGKFGDGRPAPHVIDHGRSRHAVEPGQHPIRVPHGPQMGVDPKKDLLEHVLGRVGVVDPPADIVADVVRKRLPYLERGSVSVSSLEASR
jgi:hypothetical protein